MQLTPNLGADSGLSARRVGGRGRFNPEARLVRTATIPKGSLDGFSNDIRTGPVVFAANFAGLDPYSAGGLIAEFGGNGVGSFLGFDKAGEYDSNLILRFGNGAERWAAQTWYGVYDKAIFQGSGAMVVSFDFDTEGPSVARMFWNGELIEPLETSGPVTTPQWAGSNLGNYLDMATNITLDESLDPAGYQSASDLRSYSDQTVGHRVPEGLQWPARYNFTAIKSAGSWDVGISPRSLVNPAIFEGKRYHVRPETGDDDSSGLGEFVGDFSSAMRTVRAAITAGNATGEPYAIYIDASEVMRESNLTQAALPGPTQPCALIGLGGQALYQAGPDPAGVSWTLVSGTTYSAPVSASRRVLRTDVLDEFGLYQDLEEKGDVAAVNAQVNSWCIDGSTTYVNIGEAPTGNILTLRNFRALDFSDSVEDLYLENLTIHGGGTGNMRLTATAERNVVGNSVNFQYVGSANKGSNPQDAVTIQNTTGLLAFFDSRADFGHKDGWNFHQDAASETNVLMVNCQGYRSGRDTDTSSNAFTTHDEVKAAVIGCSFGNSFYGTDVHCIQNSRTWCLDVDVTASDADGSSTAFKCSNSSFMWLEGTRADASGQAENYAIEANGGTVYKRGHVTSAGTETAYSGGSITDVPRTHNWPTTS